MNNDLKTTVSAAVMAISGLFAYFDIIIPQEVGVVIASVAALLLGYFTNKKVAP